MYTECVRISEYVLVLSVAIYLVGFDFGLYLLPAKIVP